ncbi:hypothetical protein BT69DRAFT_170134 [Atractiella rhizophila]|nr:hypothetical protein BT69DRAFT_170134 [Atractiella rhizophila]
MSSYGDLLQLPPEALASLSKVLEESRTYTTAVCAIYYYDWLVTAHQEYRMIWKGRSWSPVRIAFLVNRHFGLIFFIYLLVLFRSDIAESACKRLHFLQPAGAAVLYLSSATILGFRSWAMWERRPWVGYLLCVAVFAVFIIEIVCFRTDVPVPIPPGDVGCISNGGEGALRIVYWAAPLSFDLLALTLTLIPILSYWRRGGRIPVLELVLRDGLLYFVVVFTTGLLNFIWFALPSAVVTNHALHAPLVTAATSIACSRLVLSMRDFNRAAGASSSRSHTAEREGSSKKELKPTGLKIRVQSISESRADGGTGTIRNPQWLSPDIVSPRLSPESQMGNKLEVVHLVDDGNNNWKHGTKDIDLEHGRTSYEDDGKGTAV